MKLLVLISLSLAACGDDQLQHEERFEYGHDVPLMIDPPEEEATIINVCRFLDKFPQYGEHFPSETGHCLTVKSYINNLEEDDNELD